MITHTAIIPETESIIVAGRSNRPGASPQGRGEGQWWWGEGAIAGKHPTFPQ